MTLRLGELRTAADRAINDQSKMKKFVLEVKRLFGRATNVSTSSAALIAERANDALDVIERSGAELRGHPDVVALRIGRAHRDPEVRRLTARLLPVNEIAKMAYDEDRSVRHAVARRLTTAQVSKLLESFCDDDELHIICEAKRQEDKEDFARFSGEASRQDDYQELSDHYYGALAEKFIADYGVSWQQNWPLMVKRYVSSVRASSGTKLDAQRLMDAIKDNFEEREKEILDASTKTLRETVEYLEGKFEPLDESPSPVQQLLWSTDGGQKFLNEVKDLYAVKESLVPRSFKKHLLGAATGVTTVPQRASTPHGGAVNESDERVLDRFVEAWNRQRRLEGEPIKLAWYQSPVGIDTVGFSVTLI